MSRSVDVGGKSRDAHRARSGGVGRAMGSTGSGFLRHSSPARGGLAIQQHWYDTYGLTTFFFPWKEAAGAAGQGRKARKGQKGRFGRGGGGLGKGAGERGGKKPAARGRGGGRGGGRGRFFFFLFHQSFLFCFNHKFSYKCLNGNYSLLAGDG